MTTAALLLREIETMPEEAAAQVLDFAMFIKGKYCGCYYAKCRRYWHKPVIGGTCRAIRQAA
jgi:hypothetical protein